MEENAEREEMMMWKRRRDESGIKGGQCLDAREWVTDSGSHEFTYTYTYIDVHMCIYIYICKSVFLFIFIKEGRKRKKYWREKVREMFG